MQTGAAPAILHPPGCLAAYRLHTLTPEPSAIASISAGFGIRCGACGSDRFAVLGFPLTVPDPSPYSGVRPGEMIFRAPHRLCCASCAEVSPLLDLDKHGYDGALGHGSSYNLGTDGDEEKSFGGGIYRIKVHVLYNIELAELAAIQEESGVRAVDLFDAVSIIGEPVDGGPPLSLDYECA